MGAKPLEIHPEALAEFKAAVVWYVDKSDSAAVNFVAEIDNAIKLITASPQRWSAAERGTRKFVLRRYPYARQRCAFSCCNTGSNVSRPFNSEGVLNPSM